MARLVAVAMFLLCHGVVGQQSGNVKAEDHLPLSVEECTKDGCTKQDKSVTLDANWRWLHKVDGFSNCYSGSQWDAQACSTPQSCAQNCALEGVTAHDYTDTYGVASDGEGLTLGYKTGSNVGSRTYLLEDETHYKVFKLLNREFTFDVDVSNLPCGVNGALYFSEMAADGGMSEFSGNAAGAKYGTGYCDAQCPRDIKFINGEANTLDWSTTTATGKMGACCAEMDIWEANKAATAYTPHPCSATGPKRCENEGDCGTSGFCDKPGCDLNPYRLGDKAFYGEGSGFSIDTTKPFTIVTQFITSNNTDTGDLVEIRRKYVQEGRIFETPSVNVDHGEYNSISTDFCTATKKEFNEKDEFSLRGGLKQMGKALGRGMVLVMSIWDDTAAHMQWLDGSFPVGKTGPGVVRGPCDPSTGEPSATRAKYPNSLVQYSNIKFGAIGSTTVIGSGIQSGDTIFLKTHSGTGNHIDVEGNAVQARWESQGNWQAIAIEKENGGSIQTGDTVYLKSHTGVHIDVTGTDVQARWNDKGGWQAVVIEKKSGSGPILPDDLVCLKSQHTGKHLDVEDQVVRARWNDCGDWQTMLIQKEVVGAIFSGDSIHLAAHTGKRIEVEGSTVQARWSEPGWWQTFVIENYGGRAISSGDEVFIKAHTGKLLDVQDFSVQARWDDRGAWQKMIIEKKVGSGAVLPGDSIFLRAHTGNRVEVDGDNVQARWADRGAWQSLIIEKSTSRRLITTVEDDAAPVLV